MNDNTNLKKRALGAFAAMGSIPDRFVAAAEDVLFESEAGLSRPPRLTSPFRRFLRNGWVAAAVGLVVLGTLAFVLRAPLFSGLIQPHQPAYSPTGSTISMSPEEAPFIVSTEYQQYAPGETSITVILTTASPGMPIEMHNAWHLERSMGQGYEVVEIAYAEGAIEARPSTADDYATISTQIRIPDGLKEGEYRLHATRHNGKEYESISFCDFAVRVPEPMTELVTAGPTVLQTTSEAAINLHTFQAQYPSGTTSVTVVVTNANVGMGLVLDNEWELCRVLLSPDGVNLLEEVPVRQADDTNRILIPNEYECAQDHVVLNTDGLEDGLYCLTATHTDNTLFHELASCFFVVGSLDHEGYRSDSGIITTYVNCELYLFPGLSTFLLDGPVPNYSAKGTYEERDGYLYLTINAGTEWETRWVFKREDKTLMAVTDMATGLFANDFPDGSCLYRASQGTP